MPCLDVSGDLTLRPVTSSDDDFLLQLYDDARPDVASFGWDETERAAFIRMQFEIRRRSYLIHYPKAEQTIIVFRKIDAGQAIVDRGASRITLIDIAVLAKFRNNGIATSMIARLQSEAAKKAIPVELSVDKLNLAAFHLYRKLGFEIVTASELAVTMRWNPTSVVGRMH